MRIPKIVKRDQNLFDASRACDPEMISLYLKKGANPNCESFGFTPLLIVAQNCRIGQNPVAAASILIDAGADVNFVNERGENALNFEVEGPCFDLVKFLVEKGASLLARTDADYPLENATEINIVKFLLEHAMDPTAKGMSGVTPIENAIRVISEYHTYGDPANAAYYSEIV